MTAPSYEDEGHAALRSDAREFATEEIAPHAATWEGDGAVPRELHQRFAQADLRGVGFPPECGGRGGDLTHVLAMQEELILAGTSPGVAVALLGPVAALFLIVSRGTPAQRARFVEPVLVGRKQAAFAQTEPHTTDGGVAPTRTIARREGDVYRLDGTKWPVTASRAADFVIIVASAESAPAQQSIFVVDGDAPGLRIGRETKKLGWSSIDACEVLLEGCRVPVEARIGEEGRAGAYLLAEFHVERLLLAGQCVAIAELARREASRFARTRVVQGRPLGSLQVIRHQLADMATRVSAARALLWDASARLANEEPVMALAAKAKSFAADVCVGVCDDALRMHGAVGCFRDSLVERLVRDARLYAIVGGTQEMMNDVIASDMDIEGGGAA